MFYLAENVEINFFSQTISHTDNNISFCARKRVIPLKLFKNFTCQGILLLLILFLMSQKRHHYVMQGRLALFFLIPNTYFKLSS